MLTAQVLPICHAALVVSLSCVDVCCLILHAFSRCVLVLMVVVQVKNNARNHVLERRAFSFLSTDSLAELQLGGYDPDAVRRGGRELERAEEDGDAAGNQHDILTDTTLGTSGGKEGGREEERMGVVSGM